MGCCWRNIDDPTTHEWSTVVNSDNHRVTIALMGYAHERSKRKSFVSSGHAVRIGFLAICSSAS